MWEMTVADRATWPGSQNLCDLSRTPVAPTPDPESPSYESRRGVRQSFPDVRPTPERVEFSLPAKTLRRRSHHDLYDTKGTRAMTSDETGKIVPAVKVSRRGNLTRRREGGPELLNPRMRRMIDLMVFGHPDDPSGTQYDIYDAAAAVGYRRKAARDLQASPVFQAAYMQALASLQNQ